MSPKPILYIKQVQFFTPQDHHTITFELGFPGTTGPFGTIDVAVAKDISPNRVIDAACAKLRDILGHAFTEAEFLAHRTQ